MANLTDRDVRLTKAWAAVMIGTVTIGPLLVWLLAR